jgi:hypothetical protein
MTTHEEYVARIETLSGMPIKELKSLKPRELWRRLHGDSPIKVKSFFPATGGGGSVLHSVSVLDQNEVNSAIECLGK